MRNSILSLDDDLRGASRMAELASGRAAVHPMELVLLIAAGVAASLLTNLARLRLGIPGSSIMFAVFPMALGLALVPRRGAGLVMGSAALGTSVLLGLAGVRLDGVGAQTSLVLTGPLLDVALRVARRGWRLYGAFIVAGAASNAVAFVVRGAAKALGIHLGSGGGGGRQFAAWWPHAIVTYAAAGVIAGLISALAWFHLRAPNGGSGASAPR